MIAVAGGLGAALCWALATIVSSRSSKMIGPSAVLGWVMLVGAAGAFVPALVTRPDGDLGGGAAILSVVAGAAYVAGLYLNYRALRIGPVGIAAPIASTEGALAAVIAVLLGEPLGLVAAAMLGLIALGVVLASMAPSAVGLAAVSLATAEDGAVNDEAANAQAASNRATSRGSTRTTAGFALAAASLFAIGLVASARAVTLGMPVAWVALVARVIGIAAVTVPVALRGRLTMVRPAVPLVVAAGLGEVIGTSVYTIGAQGGIAIAAVIASQFATIAAVAAYVVFGERLSRFQMAGIGLVVVGVTAISALSV